MIPGGGSTRIRPHAEAGKRGRAAALSKREGGTYILPAMLEGPTKPTARLRIGTAATVLVLHLVVIAGLIRALAPGMGEALVTSATQAFDVPLPTPTPSPTPSASREAAPEPAGAAAPEGRKAVPREAAAPPAVVPLPRPSVPPVASTGAADTSGARDRGTGTGGGGAGTGTGSGAGGNGSGGGGGGAKAVKIAGDINSARDYPAATRSLRLGASVVIALTVDPQGSVSACRVVRPSPDPEADRITCRLAQDRFRFRPARDGAGNPVVSVYGWQQRWFAP